MGTKLLRVLIVGIHRVRELLPGHAVRFADNGEQAIRIIEWGGEDAADLVIAPFMLPGRVSGQALVRALREHWLGTRVILVSNLGQTAIEEIAPGCRPDGLLKPPLDGDLLERTIAEVFGRPAVLVVDDDPSVRSAFAAFLTDDGWEVRAAGSGEEAEAIIGRGFFAPVLVITDLHMSGMSGAVLTRHLKERFGLVVIGMTGASAEEDIAAFREAGADVVLQKPVSWDTVEGAIRKLLRSPSAALAS